MKSIKDELESLRENYPEQFEEYFGSISSNEMQQLIKDVNYQRRVEELKEEGGDALEKLELLEDTYRTSGITYLGRKRGRKKGTKINDIKRGIEMAEAKKAKAEPKVITFEEYKNTSLTFTESKTIKAIKVCRSIQDSDRLTDDEKKSLYYVCEYVKKQGKDKWDSI